MSVNPVLVPQYSHNEHLPVFFYGGWLSSFAPFSFRAPMLFDDPEHPAHPVYWQTREHWYQAHKTLDPSVTEAIADAGDPWAAKGIGNSRRLVDLREGWDEGLSYSVMLEGIRRQLDRYEDLAANLRATDERFIAEVSPVDKIWGYVVGDDGELTGKNWLGACWMDCRAEL